MAIYDILVEDIQDKKEWGKKNKNYIFDVQNCYTRIKLSI